MAPERYDLIVVGAGPAGRAAALGAASPKRRVALIDAAGTIGPNNYLGGMIQTFRLAVASGQDFAGATAAARDYQASFMAEAPLKRRLQSDGVAVITDQVQLIAPGELVGQHGRYHAKTIILATGRIWRPPDWPGHEHIKTAAAVFAAAKLPQRLIFVEPTEADWLVAASLERLGSRVSLVQANPTRPMALLGRVASVERRQRSYQLNLLSDSKPQSLGAELIISAGEPGPNLSVLSSETGIKTANGFLIDHQFRTNLAKVYAAGSCLATPSHLSSVEQGSLAAKFAR